MVVLATGRGLDVAASLGLPVIVGGPVLGVAGDPAPGLEALARYRRTYRPSAQAPEPEVAISLDVLVADTAEEAHLLALPEAWAMARARSTGEFPPLEPVAAVHAATMTAGQRRHLEQTAAMAVTGTAGQVSARLAELAERTGAVELVASSSTYDRTALAASDAALAQLLGARPSSASALASAAPSGA
jgi:alkanesulfonate monooxygenase SsuD/methylene tetrahydromethanopterin reductase-like flavin-dependent oxidoreductase (luciferase family)